MCVCMYILYLIIHVCVCMYIVYLWIYGGGCGDEGEDYQRLLSIFHVCVCCHVCVCVCVCILHA
jgi:hypothetical protein